jgi:hypothetical protein
MINKTKTTLGVIAIALAATTMLASPASAQNIMGPTKIINVTSTIPGGSGTYTLPQIADGNSSDAPNFNGFQGAQNTTGVITFTLDQDYDLDAAHLWNDINVRAEGVGTYSLKFYDAAGNPVGSTVGPITTVPGQVPAQITGLSVLNVKKVDMIIHSIQNKPNTFSQRVEIREVAFNGRPSPKTVDVAGEHYQCYRILEAPTLKPENIVVADQFGKSQIVLARPIMLCNPSLKMHNGKKYGVLNQKVHQVCYSELKPMDQKPMRRVRVANQFTTAEMTVGPRQMFCVPSYKTLLNGKEFPIDSPMD